MKRHSTLVPLSHDHHHALVEARRLRRAAGGTDAAAVAAGFLRFFEDESVRHFREEEELLFPAVADVLEAREPVLQALVEHQRLHALAARLRALGEEGADPSEAMREAEELLDAHVRHEERVLFPLIERLLDEETLTRLPLGAPGGEPRGGGGPVWGAASEDLNATVLSWEPGAGPPEHVNDERDVLLVVVEGSLVVTLDGEERRLDAGEALIVEKGRRRAFSAGRDGVRYVAAHLRRPPLQIRSARG